jgi:hypothetical protein
MNDKELSNNIHLLIHSLRLINGYKPSEAEKKISRWILERYSAECIECQEIKEKIKNRPEQKTFLEKLKGAIE